MVLNKIAGSNDRNFANLKRFVSTNGHGWRVDLILPSKQIFNCADQTIIKGVVANFCYKSKM